MEFEEGRERLAIVRYTLEGAPQNIIEQSLDSDLNAAVSVDASGGQVLLAYMDGFPAAGGGAKFVLYDVDAGVVEQLDIDPSFYSQLIFSTQLFVLD